MAADDAPVGLPEAHRRLEALRRALETEIAALVQQLDTEGGAVVARLDRLANAERVRSQVIALMRDEGLPATMTIAEEASSSAARAILDKRRKPTADATELVSAHDVVVRGSFEAEAMHTVRIVVSGTMDAVPAVFGEAQQAMRTAIDQGIANGWPLAKVLEDVRTAIGTSITRATVAVDAAVRGTQQAILMEQAERGAAGTGETMLYLYLGPKGGNIREFCARHVGKAFSRSALDRLDNGTDFMPVRVYRGGPNCRHNLSPITLEDAQAEGIEVVL